MIYKIPQLTSDDLAVLAEIQKIRRCLATTLAAPHPWKGGLRRSMLARAIRGSNSIEGYVVTEDDDAAAVDDDEPFVRARCRETAIPSPIPTLGYGRTCCPETFTASPLWGERNGVRSPTVAGPPSSMLARRHRSTYGEFVTCHP